MRQHGIGYLLVLAGLGPAALAVGLSVRADGCASSEGDQHAIRAAAKDYLAALQRGDSAALVAMWTLDGDYVDASGQVFKARDLLRQRAPAALSTDPAPEEVPLRESSLRFITPEVAIEDGSSDCGISPDGRPVTGQFTAVWIKRDGRWLLDSLRETTVASPSPNDRLQALDWLLGEWVGTTDDSVMLVSTHWSEQGSYLVRQFVLRTEGQEAQSGTERIGWDPAAGNIRSWTFDSQGGSGTGHWRQDGPHWSVDFKEVMPDGQEALTSVTYTPGNDGSFLWEVRGATAAGVKVPGLRVEFRRASDDSWP